MTAKNIFVRLCLKPRSWLLLCFSLFICGEVTAFVSSDSSSSKKKHGKTIRVHKINEDAAWLRITNGGKIIIFPPHIIGVRKLESNGFRFVPAVKAPEGMMPQEHFEKRYKFNALIKELFIPYSEIKAVGLWYGVNIKTKDGKKYRIKCLYPKEIAKELRKHIVTK